MRLAHSGVHVRLLLLCHVLITARDEPEETSNLARVSMLSTWASSWLCGLRRWARSWYHAATTSTSVVCSAQCRTCQRGDVHYQTKDRRFRVGTSITPRFREPMSDINTCDRYAQAPGAIGKRTSCPQRFSTCRSELLSWIKNAASPPDTCHSAPFQWVCLRNETRFGQGSDRQLESLNLSPVSSGFSELLAGCSVIRVCRVMVGT